MEAETPEFQTSTAYGDGCSNKLCDYISDSILDACLEQDPYSEVEIDVTASLGLICVLGQILSTCQIFVDIEGIVRNCCESIGYDKTEKGLDSKTVNVISTVEVKILP